MEYKVGDVVRIINIDGNAKTVQHPTEDRTIVIGDVLTIASIQVSLSEHLLEFEAGKGGIYPHRVELVCKAGKFKVGDTVRIVDIEGNRINHPTEDRKIVNGDVLEIAVILNGPDDNGVDTQLVSFTTNGGLAYSIYSRRVELVVEDTTETAPECKCPTLIHGHHAGCPFA